MLIRSGTVEETPAAEARGRMAAGDWLVLAASTLLLALLLWWLWREARLRDPSGNVVCLYHAGDYRRHPPWRVGERELNSRLREALHAPKR